MNTLNIAMEIMTLVPTDESKETLKKYGELWRKFRCLIRSINNCLDDSKINNSENYDKVYMKIKFISDDDLLLRKSKGLKTWW